MAISAGAAPPEGTVTMWRGRWQGALVFLAGILVGVWMGPGVYDWLFLDRAEEAPPSDLRMDGGGTAPDLHTACEVDLGSLHPNAVPLDATDSLERVCAHRSPTPWRMLALWCKATGGAMMIVPSLTGDVAAPILRDVVPCTCGGAWTPCPLHGTPVLHPVQDGKSGTPCSRPPCTVDVRVAPLAATAQYLQIVFIFTGSFQD